MYTIQDEKLQMNYGTVEKNSFMPRR